VLKIIGGNHGCPRFTPVAFPSSDLWELRFMGVHDSPLIYGCPRFLFMGVHDSSSPPPLYGCPRFPMGVHDSQIPTIPLHDSIHDSMGVHDSSRFPTIPPRFPPRFSPILQIFVNGGGKKRRKGRNHRGDVPLAPPGRGPTLPAPEPIGCPGGQTGCALKRPLLVPSPVARTRTNRPH
jgi:hypothetical protein